MESKRPRGRPPKDPQDVLGVELRVRISGQSMDACRSASQALGLSLSDWVRQLLDRAVRK